MTLPVDYAQQLAYFTDLVARLNALAQVNGVITVTKTTEPSQQDFVTAWIAAGGDLPIPENSEFHWFDGVKVRGVYGTVQDGFIAPVLFGLNSGSLSIIDCPDSGPQFSKAPNDERIIRKANPNSKDSGNTAPGKLMLGDMGRKGTVIPNSHTSDAYVSWHPDGLRIAFATTEFSGGQTHIAKMNVDGTGRTQLTTTGTKNAAPSWVGTKIAFVTDRHGASNAQIYIMNDDGTGETRLTNNAFKDVSPQISPDGTKIVFMSNRNLGIWQVWIMDSNGSNQTALPAAATDGLPNMFPQWNADGTKIYYLKPTAYLNSFGSTVYRSILWRMNPDGSGDEQVGGTTALTGAWIQFEARITDNRLNCFSLSSDDQRYIGVVASDVFGANPVFAVHPTLEASTGYVWLLQPDHSDWSDLQLLGELLGDGNLRDLTVSNIRAEFDNLMIVVGGSIDSAITSDPLQIICNGDASALYYTLYQSAVAAAATRTEALAQTGWNIPFDTDVTDVDTQAYYYLFMPDIHSLEAHKAIIYHGGRVNSYAASGYEHVHGMGIYASLNDVNEISIRNANGLPFLTGTKISVYGLGGRGRFKAQ